MREVIGGGRRERGKNAGVPPGGGDVHEKVGSKRIEEIAEVVTPDTALERLTNALKPFLSQPVNTEKLLKSLEAPRKYTDSEGISRRYSFPKEFELVEIIPPTYYGRAESRIPMFSWTLGIARTKHDPKLGKAEKTWVFYTGPEYNLINLTQVEKNSPDRYPTSFSMYRENEPTCWARFHLLLPETGHPFIGVSALQNVSLRINDKVYAELNKLKDSSSSKWKGHYNRVMEEYSSSIKVYYPNSFAYPNRALLLPPIGLKVVDELGVKAYAMTGRYDDDRPIYKQAFDFLKGCKTDTNLAFTGKLVLHWLRKDFLEQCDFDLALKER